MTERVLTKQASEMLRLSPDRVRDLVDEGLLPALRVGGIRLIERRAVERLAEERKQRRSATAR